jgi:hypothetical protein
MKKAALLLGLLWSSVYGQTTTRKVPIPYYPPLPTQSVVKMIQPKDKNITPNVASASFTSISPTASPEVSQSNHLQDISVNQYTGTPMVGIPLYSLQEGKLGISFGMNYNASGVRGHQLSGWTGLGWDLVGVPTVTRIVRGLPDEGKFDMTSWTTSVGRKGYSSSFFGLGVDDDQEPDYFFLNIGGASYKFIIKNNGEIKFITDNDIKGGFGSSPRDGSSVVRQFDTFLFTLSDGTSYSFTKDAIENTAEVEVGFAQANQVYPFPYNVNSPNFAHYLKNNAVTSAWYCKQITSPQGQKFDFSYHKVLYSYYKLADNEATGNCPSSVDKKVNRVFVEGAVIAQVESQHTVVKFNDGYVFCITLPHPVTLQPQEFCSLIGIDNREDIDDWTQNPSNSSPAKIMKNMVVYDKTNPSQKMTWTFDYGYFTGTDNSGYDLPSGYSYAGTNPVGLTHKKRLKLTSIHSPDGNQSDFKYYGEESGFNFKTRFTYGIDHWGYINGADGNISGMGLIGSDFLGSCGANRATDISFLRYGSLEKITHSAGSTIELSYETHQAKNYGSTPIGGLRIQQVKTKDYLRGTETIKSYDYTAGGQSTGFLVIKPIYRFDGYNATRYTNSALYDLLMSEAGRPSVGYGQVTETLYDVTNAVQVGKTISYYDQDETELSTANNGEYCYYDENTGEQICTPTVAYYLDNFIPQYDFRGGSLLKQENYKQGNQKLSESLMAYTSNGGLAVDSLFCQRVVKLNGVNQSKYYYLKTKKYRPEQTISKTYSEDGTGTAQSSTVDLVYKDEMPLAYRNTYKGKHNQLVKSITTDSYGYTVEQLNKYVADFNFDVDSTLMCEPDCFPQNPCPETCKYWNVTVHVPATGTEASGIYNMLYSLGGYPVESISKRNGKVISATYQTYSNRLGISSYALRTVPKANFSEVVFVKTGDVMNKDAGYGTARSEVLTYNTYGLPSLVEMKRGAKSQILYDTKNVLPISKTANYGISDALTSTYEYVRRYQGVSKEVSPNNLEVRYDYRASDSRLDKLTDKDGSILKKYNYDLTGSFNTPSITWDNTRRTKLCGSGQITLSVYVNGLAVGATAQFSTNGGSTWQNANIGSDGYAFTLTPTNAYQNFLARASNNLTATISTQYHASCTTKPPLSWSSNSCTNVGGTCNFYVSVSGLATDSFAEFSIDGSTWYRANNGNNGYNVSVPYGSGGQQYFLMRAAEDHSVGDTGNLGKCQ